jgi:hypothetical protein
VVGRFEIWFPSADEVSVVVETDLENGPIRTREMLETAVFAALAAGVIANLPKHMAKELSTRLAEFPRPTSDEDIPASVGDVQLVLPRPERGRKGFEGTFEMRGPLPVAKLKPRGFRLFGREVQDYVQTATMAVFLHLLLGFTQGGRVVLVETAHNLGFLGQLGEIKMTTHAHAAGHALDQAAETADAESNERDDASSSS